MSIPYTCSICRDAYSEDADHDGFAVTPCGHMFHLLCIQRSMCTWGFNCPIQECLSRVTPQNIIKVKTLGQPRPAPRSPSPTGRVDLLEDTRDADHTLKIVTIGSGGVGKSNLISRYAENYFSESHITTIGCDFKIKHLVLNNKHIRIQIWDTGGQERFRAITQSYIRDADGVLLVYDVTDMSTFTEIDSWYKYLIEGGLENVDTVLVGNKTDIDVLRVVRTTAGIAAAKQYGIPFFETSAKDNTNVDAAFRKLVGNIIMNEHFQTKQMELKRRRERIHVQVDSVAKNTKKKKKGCCG